MNISSWIDWTELSIQWMLTCGHFLWQGFLIALFLIVVERSIPLLSRLTQTHITHASTSKARSATKSDILPSASTRYALSCMAFLLMPVCILLTFAVVHSSRGPLLKTISPPTDNQANSSNRLRSNWKTAAEPERLLSPPTTKGLLSPHVSLVATAKTMKKDAVTQESGSLSQRAIFLAPTLSATYATVAVLMLVRLSLSVFGSIRDREVATRVTDPHLLRIIETQANRLMLKTVPIVATCMHVASPVAVGIVRPMILLPPSLLCGLAPTQLAAILSHEMAHIRRYDLVVNLLQRIVESLLFFHPITWWLSRRVTLERENCCDDVAASMVGRLTYAGALLQMASVCLANHRKRGQELAALAADGSNSTDFGYRIRRLIDAQESPKIRFTKRKFAIGFLVLSCMWASLVALAQSPTTKKNDSVANSPSNTSLDNTQWSTWGEREGLLSGARLILPDGVVTPGQPVVVEYRLKNVSTETKKFSCYVRGNRSYLTLASNNRIGDMGIDIPDSPIQLTIEPGEEFVAHAYRVSIDTRGLSPGEYEVALGSAFFYPDEINPGAKQEIPHRGSIPFTIQGAPLSSQSPPLDNRIHWGDAISGLRLGAMFRTNSNSFSIGDSVEADLWIANVTNQAIEFTIRLPHPLDGWLMNIEDHLGNTIMLQRPPLVSIFSPQRFLSLRLAPGEMKPITSEAIEGKADYFAGRSVKFKIVNKSEDHDWGDNTIKGQLETQGGTYSAVFSVTLDRPEVPGLRIELDTGNCPFNVGKPNIDPRIPRILDDATDHSILWGDPSNGLRLGVRRSEFARQRSTLKQGERIEYEVWIKNESNEVVQIARDPRNHRSPQRMNDQSINVIGGGGWSSFDIPQEELTKAELILPPGYAARRFLEHFHSASIRPPGSPRGRYGSDPLLLEPGKFKVFAQIDGLKSGIEEVEIVPAARLQVRKSSQVTDQKREYAATDPSEDILSWKTGSGEMHEAMVNWDFGVLIDEQDLVSVEIVPTENHPSHYSISFQLRPESATWLSERIRSYSLWDDPDMVTILFDGKPLGTLQIPSSIKNESLVIPTHLPRQQAEAIAKGIQSAIAIHRVLPPSTTAASSSSPQRQGVTLTGEVKLPKEEWLFRRQVQQRPDKTPTERPLDFKGDTIDPEDGRLVHVLTRNDILALSVTIKANDGRDYSQTIKTDPEGRFRFNEVLPIGSYQIDVNAVLTMDDDSKALFGEPPIDLRAGTQLLRVAQGDMGEKPLSFELYPVPFNNRLRHADPTQRTEVMGKLTENNQPVPNARVVLYGGIATRWKIAEGITDERGHYRFENVVGEFIGVQVKHEKMVPADGKSWRDIYGLKVGTLHRLDLKMTRGGFITGQLLDDKKQPRAKVPLRIRNTQWDGRNDTSEFLVYVTSDDLGNFTSEALYPGTYVIEENVNGYPKVSEVEVKANQTTTL